MSIAELMSKFTMLKKDIYWYNVCPFCNQGRLFVFKNLKTNKLYLHCEECERGYYDIYHIDERIAF
jgi:uncharacterized protein (DUF983 family)